MVLFWEPAETLGDADKQTEMHLFDLLFEGPFVLFSLLPGLYDVN